MIVKEERIGGQRLILGDCLSIMPTLGRFGHVICDPPYEAFMHDAKGSAARRLRTDGRREIKALNFAGIDAIRGDVVAAVEQLCDGWFIAFCTPEGVGKWADAINASKMKYKRACVWVKPDSTPQLNGQGPAMGAENFVCAWAGAGFARWNAGGKRGVYKHTCNPPDREGTHPTEKPWRLFAELLDDFTNREASILDPFAGSGTTAVAAEKLGRTCTAIELDPDYFDVMCRRVDEAARQPDLLIPETRQPPIQEQLL